MYPCCKTLELAIAKKGWSPADLAQKTAKRFNRKRSGGYSFDGDFIQGLIDGERYAPDTLRENIASIVKRSVKSLFPEYLIECTTLQKFRVGEDITQAKVAELASAKAEKTIRPFDISAYERGHRFCHPDTRVAIAESLGFTVDEMFPEYADFVEVS